VTAATSRLVPEPLDWLAASMTILIAVVTNTASKLALAAAMGRGRFAVEVAVMTVLCWVAGAGGLWLAISAGFAVPH